MVRKIEVDLWKTGMHKVEVGIKKQAEHRAKSRQFTSDSDIIGEYNYEDEQSSGYLAIRTDPLEAELGQQRIVLKMFTESMNWKGTIEEMVAVGVTRTIAADEGMPAYIINLSNYDNLIRLERVFKPKSFNKAMYTFMFIDDDKLDPYYIEANRLTFGSDWTVFNRHGTKVAKVDGKKLNIGGKWDIEIYDEDFEYHPAFDEVILMFSALVKFEDDVRDRLEEIAKKLKKKDESLNLKIASEEVDLYDNPRRLKY